MTFNKNLLLATVILVCSSIRSSYGRKKSPCPESVDIASINIKKCHQNRKEMEDRSETFKCKNRKQNCTTPDLYKYHCVLNSKGDGYIELCAPEVEIVGRHCTEFTTGGQFLQEHLESSCATCPFKYLSSESYKYNECYKLEFPQNHSSIMKENTTKALKNKLKIVVSKKEDMDDRLMDDAVKDTEDTHPGVASVDKDTIDLPIIITIICTITVAFYVFVVILHRKRDKISQRRQGDRKTIDEDERKKFPITI